MSDAIIDAAVVRKACERGQAVGFAPFSPCLYPNCTPNLCSSAAIAICAILAERDRCAGKATAEGAKHTDKHPERATVAWNIAAAIRSDQ